ncbi:hypothetical protein HAX54_039816, partial [Datura stramonium]|nr:hypothetical protein [Datura stramonium]
KRREGREEIWWRSGRRWGVEGFTGADERIRRDRRLLFLTRTVRQREWSGGRRGERMGGAGIFCLFVALGLVKNEERKEEGEGGDEGEEGDGFRCCWPTLMVSDGVNGACDWRRRREGKEEQWRQLCQ